jgi:hypothetical protein
VRAPCRLATTANITLSGRFKDEGRYLDLDELRSELDDFAQPEKKGGRSSRDERIIAGFEDIHRFVQEHGRAPQHGEDRDIFERLYEAKVPLQEQKMPSIASSFVWAKDASKIIAAVKRGHQC